MRLQEKELALAVISMAGMCLSLRDALARTADQDPVLKNTLDDFDRYFENYLAHVNSFKDEALKDA